MTSGITSYLGTVKRAAEAVLPQNTAENVVLTGAVAAGVFFGPYALAGGLAVYARERLLGQQPAAEAPKPVSKVLAPKVPEPKVTQVVKAALPSPPKPSVPKKPLPPYKPEFHRLGTGLEDTPWSVTSKQQYDELYGHLPDAPVKPHSAKSTAFKMPSQAAKGGKATPAAPPVVTGFSFPVLASPPRTDVSTAQSSPVKKQSETSPITSEQGQPSPPVSSDPLSSEAAPEKEQPSVSVSSDQPLSSAAPEQGQPPAPVSSNPLSSEAAPEKAAPISSDQPLTAPASEKASAPVSSDLPLAAAAPEKDSAPVAGDQAPAVATSAQSLPAAKSALHKDIVKVPVAKEDDPLRSTTAAPVAVDSSLTSAKTVALTLSAPASADTSAKTAALAQSAPPSNPVGNSAKGAAMTQSAPPSLGGKRGVPRKPAAPQPPPVGFPDVPPIKNGGNTCPFSSVLWAFFFNDSFIEEQVGVRLEEMEKQVDFYAGLTVEEQVPFQNKREVLIDLSRLIQKAKKGEFITAKEMTEFRAKIYTYYPDLEIDKIGNKEYRNRFGQKDAEAVLSVLMNLVVAENQFKFGAERVVEAQVPDVVLDDSTTNEEGNAWHLPISLPFDDTGKILKGVSLSQSLSHHFVEDFTKYDLQYREALYRAKDCPKKMPFLVNQLRRKWRGEPPPFLAVVQRRFLSSGEKLVGPVGAPQELVFSAGTSENRYKTKYRLQAVVFHSGTISGGHYTAFVKKGDKDYYCNDLTGSPLETDQMAVGAANGYILKYVLVETTKPS